MASVFKKGGKKNRGGYWYIKWTTHDGKVVRKSSRTTDKAAAERIAAKYETDAALRRTGVVDPGLEQVGEQARRTIGSHLEDFKAKLKSANRDPKHIEQTARQIQAIAEQGGIERACEITADKVVTAIDKLSQKRKGGFGPRTVQAYITAMKAFTTWLADPVHRKIVIDPLSSLAKPDPKKGRRRERRMLLPNEWIRLRQALLDDGVVRREMTAEARLLLYALAIQTGLRSGELRSLTPGRLFLAARPPYVTCKAGATKDAADARQYIHIDLAEDLLRYLKDRSQRTSVFSLPDETAMADLLREDLAAARAAWLKEVEGDAAETKVRTESDFLCEVNHEGERLDFHSLRHTCGAWLAMNGAHPKAIQSIMRHSTITLTMDTYGHLFQGQEAETIAKLPSLLTGRVELHHLRHQTGFLS